MKVQTIDINRLVRSDILEAEFWLLDRIRSVKMAHVHPGKGHVVHILDRFQLDGSSGAHTCPTFPVVGPISFRLSVCITQQKSRLRASLQNSLLLALAYLHDECKIVHTGQSAATFVTLSLNSFLDLKPANFALVIDDVGDLVRSCLVVGNDEDKGFPAAGLPFVPPTVELRIPSSQQQLSKLSIQLIDFGSG